MHKRSFGMRGGSIVGAVLVVALLSATVVTLESQKVQPTAMFAGAKLAIDTSSPNAPAVSQTSSQKSPSELDKDTNKTCAKNIDGKTVCGGYVVGGDRIKALTCQYGNDFVLRRSLDGAFVLFYEDSAKGNAVASARNLCNAPMTTIRGQVCGTESARTWKCRIDDCTLVSKDEKAFACSDANALTDPKRHASIGENIAAKAGDVGANASSAATSADVNSYKEETDKLLSGVNNPNVDSSVTLEQITAQEKKYEEQISQEQNRIDGYKKIKELADKGNCSGYGMSCEELRADADREIAEAEARKAALEEQRMRLASAAKTLQPSQSNLKDLSLICPPTGCQTGTWNPQTQRVENPDGTQIPGQYCVTSCYPLHFIPNKYDASCLNHPSNPNRQIMCQPRGSTDSTFGSAPYGGQQVVVSPGYGGAQPSSGAQPCGAQQQQGGVGGLIGVALSLFLKSSSSNSQGGCQNGVPVPSCTITASPTNVATAGQPVTLTWQSQQAFQATLSSSGNVSTNGSMTVNPQQTTTYTLQLGGYVDNRTGQQLRGQCAVQVTVGGTSSGDGAPKAEISCRPEIADVGMSVALSFGCRNASTSGGTGFDTNNQMSGSATPVIESPTIGSDTVKYGLTCSKEGRTDTAECTVRINKPTIVLIANPKEVASGGEANIGWVTSGMEECAISSPTLPGFTAENAGNTSTSGVAKTPKLSNEEEFLLTCTTKSGATKTAKTTVKIR